MSGVSAVSSARGAMVAAPGSADPLGDNAGRVEVVEATAIESVWALRTSWYEGNVHPTLTDWWWRRLDCFVAERDDPRLSVLFDRIRRDCRWREPPFEPPSVVDAATGQSGIVELILEKAEPRLAASVWDRSNDLMVDMIHMQRSRW